MFKKILATAAAVLLGAGLSVVAVAAPASAHSPAHDVSCSELWFKADAYETRQNNSKPNSVTITIDNGTPTVYNFGASLSKKTFPLVQTVAHTWSIVVDAVGGSGPDTQYDVTYSGTTTPCAPDGNDKVWVCHATPPESWPAQGWNRQEIKINQLNGHVAHDADIIPVIPVLLPNGKNLTTVYPGGYTGQQLLDSYNCVLPPRRSTCAPTSMARSPRSPQA